MTAHLRLQPEALGMGMTSQRVRDRLIERLREQGIRDESVLNAIRTVPRHLFVDEALAARAYEDNALPIGHGQTISQPWVVARMTEALFEQDASDAAEGEGEAAAEPFRPKKVLEVGTGSGYQAAILAALGLEVYTVERIGDLLRTARKRFRTLGLNVRSKHDDGRIGWSEHAPYDGIVVTAAAPALVDALTEQLAVGGVLVAPVGGSNAQSLVKLRKRADGRIARSDLASVVFVPLLSGTIDG
ncbi:MAG: protein-L-isoaspartate O-methyltransferase [Lysobacter sp.]|nr:MAG: protein-L-isoaspartate O-methyltransferase [Lysobacter sp.]